MEKLLRRTPHLLRMTVLLSTVIVANQYAISLFEYPKDNSIVFNFKYSITGFDE